MKQELSKTYNPQEIEDRIYEKWEKSGYFNPDNLPDAKSRSKKGSYTIVLPPPNITDRLHLGHAVMLAVEDLLIRYKRMNGYSTLWVPGTDHAAIATQNVVEKKILAEDGQSRHDLGREKFLAKVWEFLEETQATILKQSRKMGASLDWSRLAFTLDEQRQQAVRQMFIQMYNEGIIYRGERVVNWCPRCHSTLADDEVEYQEQQAKLYTFKYSADFPMAISTTRPETKLGDTAVAVNPKDERYKKYIGQEYDVDFCGVKLHLKVIANHEVDQNFGTGALGVTPAHSLVDEAMAKEENLTSIKVIDEDGKIRPEFKPYAGLDVKAAREKIVAELKKKNLLEKEEDINNNLSICYRCNTSIEPLPSKQWFISVDKKLKRLQNKSLKEAALAVAQTGEIKFVPERFGKRYSDWMENLHDWCISRQIWFGHQIPVWYRGDEIKVGETAPIESGWTQDPDTLDTWFSSGMWTFSTLGWPEQTSDLKRFHPTQVLETGYEIITLWVSRMIMMSLFALGEIPFENVYLHGMILDAQGKKMSKSKGNGIDPLEVAQKYGTDAVRLSVLLGGTPGNDNRVGEKKIESYRNFTNKLWNIARYILGRVDVAENDDFKTKDLNDSDKWILSSLNKLIVEVSQDIENYDFSFAGDKLKDFTWNVLADWYLEMSKFDVSPAQDKVLIHILKTLLKLWHPFMPFVTEAIWQEMNQKDMLLVAQWPEPRKLKFNQEEARVNQVIELIKNIRNARAENQVEPSQKLTAVIYAAKHKKWLDNFATLITSLKTGISKLEIKVGGEEIKNEIYIPGEIEVYLIGGIDRAKEAARIAKEIANLEKLISGAEKRLSNQEFVKNAPKEIVEVEKERLEERKSDLAKLRSL